MQLIDLPIDVLRIVMLNLPIKNITSILQTNKIFKNGMDNYFCYQYVVHNELYYRFKLSEEGYIKSDDFFHTYKNEFNYHNYIRIFYLLRGHIITILMTSICRLTINRQQYIDLLQGMGNIEWYYAYVNDIKIFMPSYSPHLDYRSLIISQQSMHNVVLVYETFELSSLDWQYLFEYQIKKNFYIQEIAVLASNKLITYKRASLLTYLMTHEKHAYISDNPVCKFLHRLIQSKNYTPKYEGEEDI